MKAVEDVTLENTGHGGLASVGGMVGLGGLGGTFLPKQVHGAVIEKGAQEHSHSSPAGRSRDPREICLLQQQDPMHGLALGCAAALSL